MTPVLIAKHCALEAAAWIRELWAPEGRHRRRRGELSTQEAVAAQSAAAAAAVAALARQAAQRAANNPRARFVQANPFRVANRGDTVLRSWWPALSEHYVWDKPAMVVHVAQGPVTREFDRITAGVELVAIGGREHAAVAA